MLTSEFDYELPPELIAQQPLPERDASRLMVVDRGAQAIAHRQFRDLPQLLRAGDLLVLNDTKVLPARLWARKSDTGAQIELLLLEELATNRWRSLARPAKKLKAGTELRVEPAGVPPGTAAFTPPAAQVARKFDDGSVEVAFLGVDDVRSVLAAIADAPLPPYIARKPHEQHALDAERYQTIFARHEGAVAAPTAGLHFTEATFAALRAKGVETCSVTLHVGPGTFLPVKTEKVEDHPMHDERFEVAEAAMRQLQAARQTNRRIVAVGTTSLRVLETIADRPGMWKAPPTFPHRGTTRLFIYPPYQFRIVGALLTNFHLPRSTLLMLVSAFGGTALVRRAYQEAIRARYRFYSYGDCMLLL